MLLYGLEWWLFLSKELNYIVKLVNKLFHQFSVCKGWVRWLLTWKFWTTCITVTIYKFKFKTFWFFYLFLILLATFSYVIFFIRHACRHKQQLFIFVSILFLLKLNELINSINVNSFHIILFLSQIHLKLFQIIQSLILLWYHFSKPFLILLLYIFSLILDTGC